MQSGLPGMTTYPKVSLRDMDKRSHLIRAHNKNRTKPAVECLVSKECQCEEKLEGWEAPVALILRMI